MLFTKLSKMPQSLGDYRLEQLAELFPECLTEAISDGPCIDFEKLKEALGEYAIDDSKERYTFTWPEKKKAVAIAHSPATSVLRPIRNESVNFDTTKNVYIEGDNLEVLKCLRESYFGSVRVIFIDPPYNTGNDFIYKDNFSRALAIEELRAGLVDEEGNRLVDSYEVNLASNGRFHTDWLNMIYPRLKIARDFLSDDGVIFITIGDGEQANLKKICDEIFGEQNFIATLIWEKKKKPSFLNANLGSKTDFILAYAKNRSMAGAFSADLTEAGKKFPLNNAGNGIKDLTFPARSVSFLMKDGIVKAQAMSKGNIVTELLNDVLIKDGVNENAFTLRGEWRYSQAKLDEIIATGDRITISKVPFRPNHVKKGGEIKKIHNLLLLSNYDVGSNEDATAEQIDLLGGSYFDYAKPSKLIKFLVKVVTYNDPEAIVMDFFSGSATTADAVMQLNAEDSGNRRFLLVQLPEIVSANKSGQSAGFSNICDIGKKRIKEAGSRLSLVPIDIGFRVFRLDEDNFKNIAQVPGELEQSNLFSHVDNIREDRTAEDLLFQVMLSLGATLDCPIELEVIAGKEVFRVADGFLIACFDNDVTDDVVEAIAKEQPTFVVLRDACFKTDSVADNFEQIFKTYAPNTVCKVI